MPRKMHNARQKETIRCGFGSKDPGGDHGADFETADHPGKIQRMVPLTFVSSILIIEEPAAITARISWASKGFDRDLEAGEAIRRTVRQTSN